MADACIFCDCGAAPISLRSVMSSPGGDELVIFSPPLTGAIEANSQNSSPFFFLLRNSPRHTAMRNRAP
jgi:hypothetical protein